MSIVSQKLTIDNLPGELKSCPQWVCVRLEQRGGKPTKVPYQPATPTERAKVDAPSTWGTFDEATAVLEAGGCDGLGLVLTSELGLTVIDLDDVVENDECHELNPEAQAVIERFSSYTEFSQSGSGIHIVLRGKLPGKRRRKRGAEMYDSDRYFWLTGDVLGDLNPIEHRQDELDLFYAETFYEKPVEKTPVTAPTPPQFDSDDGLLEKIRASKQGPKFDALWRGNWSAYGSRSEADLALCSILHFWTGGDLDQVDALFRESGLMRPKWDERHGGQTYGQLTLERVAGGDVLGQSLTGASTNGPLTGPDKSFHLTDMGNAERFVSHYGSNIRWCADIGKWLVWTGQLWTPDKAGAIQQLAKRTVRSMYGEAEETEDSGARKRLVDHARRCESRSRLDAMVELAKSEPGIPVAADELDRDPWLLNCLNGALDLRTGDLHPARQADLCSKTTAVAYLPDADCPLWLSFLDTIFAGDSELIGFVQRWCGYCLSGDTSEQKMVINHGFGANGKSKFQEAIDGAMGDYATTAASDTFLAKRSTGIPNDVARLRGARLISAGETAQGRRLDEQFVKSATGGDTMVARYLHQEFFEFQMQGKIILTTNHRPTVSGTDHAIWRRILLVPFTVRIADEEQDGHLGEKLKDEWPGILSWMVQGCLSWQREGLNPPNAVLMATQDYRQSEDVLGGFLGDCCVVGDGFKSTAKQLYHTYENWCDENNEKVLKQRDFGMQLGERGFRRLKKGTIEWHGLGVVDDHISENSLSMVQTLDDDGSIVQMATEQSTSKESHRSKNTVDDSGQRIQVFQANSPRIEKPVNTVQMVQTVKNKALKARPEHNKVSLDDRTDYRPNLDDEKGTKFVKKTPKFCHSCGCPTYLKNGSWRCPHCGKKHTERGAK